MLLAVDAVCEHNAIDTLLSNFIKPLQGSEIATYDSDGKLDRVHCSLNINTETGRLSARRPNLQNQPALEKDRYKVSMSFVCPRFSKLVMLLMKARPICGEHQLFASAYLVNLLAAAHVLVNCNMDTRSAPATCSIEHSKDSQSLQS